MKKQCNTCTHWKRYIRLEERCLCEAISGGNYSEVYTISTDSCELWGKRKSINWTPSIKNE